MKKVLSIILALSLLILPICVVAADGTGTYDDPYQLSNTATEPITITVPAETSVYIQVNNSNGSVLSIVSASNVDYFLWYCRQTYNAATSLTLVPGVDIVELNNSGTTELTVSLKLEGGAETQYGSMEFPEPIELVENPYSGALGAYLTTELTAGTQGYYYTLTSPIDGKITVSMSAFDSEYNDMGWMFFVHNLTKSKYGSNIYSDEAESSEYSVDVSVGDEISIFATTYDPAKPYTAPAGNVGVNVACVPEGTQDCPTEITAGDHTFTAEEGSQGYYYNWTAPENGTATVTVNTATNWQYCVNGKRANGSYIYGDTHWSDDDPVVSSESLEVSAGDVLNIWVNTYDPANSFSAPAGEIDWTLSFVAGDIGGSDDDDDDIGGGDMGDGDVLELNYELSDLTLSVGTDSYAASNTYPYTVYAFEPTEVGKYTFTSTDSLIALVSSNGMWITQSTSTDAISEGVVTGTTFEWTCTSVGQAIWVASLPDTNVATITVDYEEVEIKEIPREYYENTTAPEAFVFSGDAEALEYVDTFDGVEDTAVLGADGYYHLNSADGPILFANINDPMMSLATANNYGQLKQQIKENGEVIKLIDYTVAMLDYIAAMDEETGLYPLTADLIEVFSKAGASLGWYGEGGWIGGNEADAWMFACYYSEDIRGEGDIPAGDNNDANGSQQNGAPVTGDNFFVIVSVAVVAIATTGSVLVLRRRRTN